MARRVLVADDEPSTTDLFALILGFTGYDVDRAYDGAEALDLARRTAPDIVLLDDRMPGKRGSEVARELKKDPAFSDKVVVLFSSADESETGWREAGADLFLQKPIDIRTLPEVIESLIAQKAAEKTG